MAFRKQESKAVTSLRELLLPSFREMLLPSFREMLLPSFRQNFLFIKSIGSEGVDYVLYNSPKKSKERCNGCGRPEFAVMCSGAIQGLTEGDIETWLITELDISFTHVVKRIHEEFAFIHFNSYYDASVFYQAYKGYRDGPFVEPQGIIQVKISETFYFGTRNKVTYLDTPFNKKLKTISENGDQPIVSASSSKNSSRVANFAPCDIDSEQECCSQGSSISSTSVQDISAPQDRCAQGKGIGPTPIQDIYAPFAIYNDIRDGYMNIVVFTPSISSKEDLEIVYNGDCEIIVMAKLQAIDVSGFVFINNLPNRLEIKVTLPNRIDEECKAKVTINNGVALISLKSKDSKR
ncbi:395_t:CDS:2, partial [Cetraspora pellucida]